MRTRRITTAAVGAAAALALAACGSTDTEGDGGATGGSPSETGTSSSKATEESGGSEETTTEESEESGDDGADDMTSDDGESGTSESEGDSATAGGAELTKPGTELALGDPGTIPQGDDGAALTLTVTEITKGSSKDLSKLENAEDYKKYTPVYVHYEMTGTESSSKLGGDVLEDVEPVLTTGQRAPTLTIVGTSPFKKCELNDVPDDFGPGDTESTCAVAMVTDGQEVGGARYDSGEGKYADDGQVVWME